MSEPKHGPRVLEVPPGDDRERLVCPECRFVHYDNPRVIVGSVCSSGDDILICRRAIEPRRGYWTLPAGFLELNETTEDGAKREAWEEARAKIEVEQLLAVYDVPHISQVQLIFRATLIDRNVRAGPESEEVRLVPFEQIPWGDIAFPSVRWALEHFRQVRDQRTFVPFNNPPGQSGAPPSGAHNPGAL